MERSAPPKEWKLPPGVHPALGAWRPGGAPPRGRRPPSPGFRAAAGVRPESGACKRGWRILASVAMALLLTVAAAVPAAELPLPSRRRQPGDPLPTVPPETTPPGGEESPGPVQTPEPITSAGDPLPTVPPETTPPGGRGKPRPSPDAGTHHFFSAMMNGSEGFFAGGLPGARDHCLGQGHPV